MENQIIAAVNAVMTVVRRVAPRYTAADPKVTFFRNSRVAGYAHYGKNEVQYNLDFAEKESFEDFKDTVIHEIAHLVTHVLYPNARQAHGPEFRNVCRHLGGSGKTRHSYDSTPAKRVHLSTEYKVHCLCRSHWVSTIKWNKIRKGVQFKCRACNTCVAATIIETRTVK